MGDTIITSLRDTNGALIIDQNKITQRTEQFYQTLYSTKTGTNMKDVERKILNVNSEDIPEIEIYEIERALNQTKRNKAPGEDEILPEMLKEGGQPLLQELKILFNQCLQEGKIPKEWDNAVIILLFKKGDKQRLENYRPISLVPQIYKLLTKIINNRLVNKLDNYQPPEQAGFRSGYSTQDHLQVMRNLIEKSKEYNLPLCLAFIDFEKAFDSIEH